jgi:SAM-dependent methyltransferase
LNKGVAQVQALYRTVAGIYDRISPIWVRGYRAAYRAQEQALASYLPTGGRVLDLGCGTGANLGILHRLGLQFGSYLGVDQSTAMLRRAREKYGEIPSVRFRELDLQTDSLPDGPFELTVSSWVLEHLADPAQVVHAAREALADEGHIVLLFENSMSRWQELILAPLWKSVGTRVVPDEVLLTFPGIVSVERFTGPGPRLAVMVLDKQKALSTGGPRTARSGV